MFPVAADARRAVVGECVVELRAFNQAVDAVDVVQQQRPGEGRCGLQPVEVDLFATMIGAQPHHVALVGHHIDDLVLLEKALDR